MSFIPECDNTKSCFGREIARPSCSPRQCQHAGGTMATTMSDAVTHYTITGNVTGEMLGNITDYMITGNVTGEMSGNTTD